MKKTDTITIRIDPETKDLLKEISEGKKCSISYLLNESINELKRKHLKKVKNNG